MIGRPLRSRGATEVGNIGGVVEVRPRGIVSDRGGAGSVADATQKRVALTGPNVWRHAVEGATHFTGRGWLKPAPALQPPDGVGPEPEQPFTNPHGYLRTACTLPGYTQFVQMRYNIAKD